MAIGLTTHVFKLITFSGYPLNMVVFTYLPHNKCFGFSLCNCLKYMPIIHQENRLGQKANLSKVVFSIKDLNNCLKNVCNIINFGTFAIKTVLLKIWQSGLVHK